MRLKPRYLPTVRGNLAIWINGQFIYKPYSLPTFCAKRPLPPAPPGSPTRPPAPRRV